MLWRCIIEGKSPLLSLEDFSPRWKHGVDYQIEINTNTSNKTEIIEENQGIDFSYPSLFGEFDKYLTFIKIKGNISYT